MLLIKTDKLMACGRNVLACIGQGQGDACWSVCKPDACRTHHLFSALNRGKQGAAGLSVPKGG